jgi:hypothetical protein
LHTRTRQLRAMRGHKAVETSPGVGIHRQQLMSLRLGSS